MSGDARATLEAALAASWTVANLAVYADYLQTQGDPRGDWIAMDLALLRDGARAATQEERARLLAHYRPQSYLGSRFELGFIEELVLDGKPIARRLELLAQALDSPLGPYIRAIKMAGGPRVVKRVVEAIARAPRPFLRRISLDLELSQPFDLASQLGDELIGALVAATPALEIVELCQPATLAGTALPTRVIAGFTYHRFTRLAIEVAGEPVQHVELGRLERLHGGTADDMAPGARDAWAELLLFVSRLADVCGGPVGGRPFPAATLRAVIGAIDLASYWGADWVATADQLARHPDLDTVTLARL